MNIFYKAMIRHVLTIAKIIFSEIFFKIINVKIVIFNAKIVKVTNKMIVLNVMINLF